MAIIDWHTVQGTAEWYALRAGIPTASCADKILSPKKLELSEARKKYGCQLIAERLLRWQADSLDKIQHVADGKANEPFAVAQLEEIYQIEARKVGFVRTNDRRFGASPDRVADVRADDTAIGLVIEVKCPTLPVQLERLIFGHDDAYHLQVQMQLWVAEADKAIFYSYTPRTPAYQIETGRNEPVIRKLADALERFSDELEAWTEKARSLGAYQPFADLVTPIEAEHSSHLHRDGWVATEAEFEDLINGPTSQTYDWGG